MTSSAHSASLKAAILAAIALALLVPLTLLSSLVADRVTQRDAAIKSVARGWGDRQWLAGPIIAIPVTTEGEHPRTRDWYVLPDRLDLVVELKVEEERRRLGVYQVPVYVAQVHAIGDFDLKREISRLTRGENALHLHLDQARILLPVSDPRGLRALAVTAPVVKDFEPSEGFPVSVLAAPLSSAVEASDGQQTFDLIYEGAGTQSLGFLPLARTVHVVARGNWPDPGFAEGFLPLERHIDARGFTASWQVLNLNRAYGDRWLQGSTPAATVRRDVVVPPSPSDSVWSDGAGAECVLSPVARGGRAAWVSRGVCSSDGGALHAHGSVPRWRAEKRPDGSNGCGSFCSTYALLYLLVTSESYALLAGSLALFALLTTVMLLTRKVDWYAAAPQATEVSASIGR